MGGRVFKQRAAAQKGGGWRCDLNNAAIAVDLLPAMTGNLTSTVEHLIDRLNLAAFIGNVRAAGVETAAGRRAGRVGQIPCSSGASRSTPGCICGAEAINACV